MKLRRIIPFSIVLFYMACASADNPCGCRSAWVDQYNCGGSSPTVDPKTPKIASFTITPRESNVGTTLAFKVVLDKPAPAGGHEVGISSNTITGLTSVLQKPMEYGTIKLIFKEGVKEFPFNVPTKTVPNFSETYIIFTAFNGISEIGNVDVRLK